MIGPTERLAAARAWMILSRGGFGFEENWWAMSFLGRIRRFLFGIPVEETTIARRGFQVGDPAAKERTERVGSTFVEGYHAALEVTDAARLAARLDEVPSAWQGFAYEGAAMALGLLDEISPFRRHRWRTFLAGPGDAHAYMVHVGLGWTAARVPWMRRNLARRLAKLDPLLRWLAVDGYGFHEGYFHTQNRIRQQIIPRRLTGYAERVFDQGLGRSLWFVEATDPRRVAATIEAFSPSRHADLWAGIGLASTYAGGADRSLLETLQTAAGPHRLELAQGAAFAAKARLRAGNPTPETELASQVLCGMSAEGAAAVTDRCLEDLPPDDAQPAYEQWRRRIQTQLEAAQSGTVHQESLQTT
jgi:hypothetical protein